MIAAGSMIQSSINYFPAQSEYPSTNHGNFEVVVQEGRNLVHYWRDNTQSLVEYWPSKPLTIGPDGAPKQWSPNGRPSEGWQRAQTISDKATGPGCIIQSDFKHGNSKDGNFEVVVQEGRDYVHYWLDTSNPGTTWQRAQTISDKATGPGCIIQSNLGGIHGNFEVVVQEGRDLVHYWLDTSNPGTTWQRAQTISDKATGPGCLIQDSHGEFQVVVLEGNNLVHYWRENTNPPGPWNKASVVTDRATGSACMIESLYKEDTNIPLGNFEIVIQEGNYLVHRYLKNSNSPKFGSRVQWDYGTIITWVAKGPGCIIQSDFRSIDLKEPRLDCNQFTGKYEWNSLYGFDVIVQERLNTVKHYWLLKPGLWWNRTFHPIRGDKGYHPDTRTRKVVQLTGDEDRSRGTPTPNISGTRFGIWGTDLGSSFLHNGKIYFLFGDTRRQEPDGQPDGNDLLDSVAYTADLRPSPENGINLTFNANPPRVNGICQNGSEVPVEGVSLNNFMYVFFATEHDDAKYFFSQKLILAKSQDGINFGNPLYTFSTDKFINVSVTNVNNGSVDDLPHSEGRGLLIWGSGHFAASDIFLAYMPADQIENPSSRRYYSGTRGGKVIWSIDERDAINLTDAGCVREFSVRWNKFLGLWLMLYGSDNPRGIVLQTSSKPWGPWSSPYIIFDPFTDKGYGDFIHWPGHDKLSDKVPVDRESEWGGEYAPCLIEPYFSPISNNRSTIYFTMSTWNPYQVVLMSAEISKA